MLGDSIPRVSRAQIWRIRIPFLRWISKIGHVHPARGEEHNDVFLGESDGSQPPDQEAGDAEARQHF